MRMCQNHCKVVQKWTSGEQAGDEKGDKRATETGKKEKADRRESVAAPGSSQSGKKERPRGQFPTLTIQFRAPGPAVGG